MKTQNTKTNLKTCASKKVRTRYAPSPTGVLHIGGARTALFNYLLAKHFGGDFIVRVEDTDGKRNVAGTEEEQLSSLAWLGIQPDESPLQPKKKYGMYRQSERLNIYKFFSDKLLQTEQAYYAYDTVEELEEQRQEQALRGKLSFRYDRNWLNIPASEKKRRHEKGLYSVRLAVKQDKVYAWDDIVRGRIAVNSKDIGDFILVKQDGFPTYNFAVVIDDYLMDITHVLRGEEHITNTPKQLAIYEALDWEPPQLGHLTIITNFKGEKLSKRDSNIAQNIVTFKEAGYPPHAIFNFLSLLGLTFKDKAEFMSKAEIIQKFDIKRLSKSPTKFDATKLNWFAKKYFKTYDTNFLIECLGIEKNSWSREFVEIYKQSAGSLKALKEALTVYQSSETIKRIPIKNEELEVVQTFAQLLDFQDFTVEGIQIAINRTGEILNKTGKELFFPIRAVTTKQKNGPELAKAIFLFGAAKIEKRLARYLDVDSSSAKSN